MLISKGLSLRMNGKEIRMDNHMAHQSRKRTINSFVINRVIAYLTLSDIFTWALYLSITAFVGIYMANKFDGNAFVYIGIGAGLYNLTKGISEIPIGIITDKIKSDKDEIAFLLLGNILLGLPYFFYPILQAPIAFYILQVIMGLGAAMNLVSWRKLFAKNLDRGREGLDYAVYDTIMSLVMVVFGLTIGFVSNLGQQYFDLVMVSIGVMMVVSGVWVISIFYTKNRNRF